MTQKRLFTPEDIFRFKFLTEAALSPDEKKVVYAVSKVNPQTELENQVLWIYDLEKGKSFPLTSDKGKNFGAAWSPDGSQIAFISTRSGKPQLYLIAADGGEAHRLTDLAQGAAGAPQWSPDGSQLAFTSGPKPKDQPDPSKPYRITRNIYRFDGVGYLDRTIQDIYVISAEGGEPKNLTQDAWMNTAPHWSVDGKSLLFVAGFKPDTSELYFDLKTVDLKGQVQPLLERWGMVESAVWTPQGDILFCGVPAESPSGYKSDLWLLPADGGEPLCRTQGLPVGLGTSLSNDMPFRPSQALKVSADGKQVFFSVQEAGEVQLYKAALQGEESFTKLLGGKRLNALLDAGEKYLLYLVSDFKDPVNLYVNDLQAKNEKQLTDLNRELLDELLLPEVGALHYTSEGGQMIDGWLMKPPVGEPPYPTILYVHGGPHGAYGNAFSLDFQMLAGAGFAVLFTNPRGSSGYGNDFASVIVGDLGNLDFKDVMAGVEHLIEEDLADEDRLGVCGLSYGGQMTTWAVGNTDRFKAAVSENPVVDRRAYYGISDMAAWWVVKLLGGKPQDIPEVYRKCSPITYAHKAKTPTLLVQGESDFRCTKEQSEMFYTALKVAGCVVEMVRLPDSFHAGSINGAPIVRRAQNEALLDWMKRFVLGETTMEKPLA